MRNLVAQYDLFKQLLKRDIMSRYKGSFLGILWSLINPLIMLVVYTFVYSVIFKARWGLSQNTNRAEYALVIFSALVFYNIFSEVVIRSPGLVLGNVSYVTKVVFPLEILSVVALGNAVVHSLLSLGILLTGVLVMYGALHWTILFIPLIYLPLCCLVLGISWILSSLGVFLRDISYFINIVVQVLFFMTPIFYPVTAVPGRFQVLLKINPLTGIIDNARRVIDFGMEPNWSWLCLSSALSVVIMVIGYWWFTKTKKAFADVL